MPVLTGSDFINGTTLLLLEIFPCVVHLCKLLALIDSQFSPPCLNTVVAAQVFAMLHNLDSLLCLSSVTCASSEFIWTMQDNLPISTTYTWSHRPSLLLTWVSWHIQGYWSLTGTFFMRLSCHLPQRGDTVVIQPNWFILTKKVLGKSWKFDIGWVTSSQTQQMRWFYIQKWPQHGKSCLYLKV